MLHELDQIVCKGLSLAKIRGNLAKQRLCDSVVIRESPVAISLIITELTITVMTYHPPILTKTFRSGLMDLRSGTSRNRLSGVWESIGTIL